MRIYISGPITGRTDYKKRFAEAEQLLNAAGYVVINPAKVNAQLPEVSQKDYMKTSLAMLDMSDAIFMLQGWQESKGCAIEFEYAYEHGIHIIFAGGRNGEKEADKSA